MVSSIWQGSNRFLDSIPCLFEWNLQTITDIGVARLAVVCVRGVVDAGNPISPVVADVADGSALQFRVDDAVFFLVMLYPSLALADVVDGVLALMLLQGCLVPLLLLLLV